MVRIAAGLGGFGAVALLAGCLGGGATASPTPTIPPSPTASPTVAATPTPAVRLSSYGLSKELNDVLASLDLDGINAREEVAIKAVQYAGTLIPEPIKTAYYRPSEIEGYQLALAKSLAKDGAISELEVQALSAFMDPSETRWWVLRDYITGGFFADENLKKDSDGDGIDNLAELRQHTNAYEALETDPGNLSERYAVLMNGTQRGIDSKNKFADPGNVLGVYHYFKANGYSDDQIVLLFQSDFLENPKNVSSLPGSKYFGNLLEVPLPAVIDVKDQNVTTYSVLEQVRAIPTDNNDHLTILIDAHGNNFRSPQTQVLIQPGDYLSPSQLSAALNSKQFGGAVIISSMSWGQGFFNYLTPKGPVTTIAQNDVTETFSSASWPTLVTVSLDGGTSLKNLSARYYANIFSGSSIVGTYYFSFAGSRETGDISMLSKTNPLRYFALQ